MRRKIIRLSALFIISACVASTHGAEANVDDLIGRLGSSAGGPSATALAQIGPSVVPRIIVEMKSPNPYRRQWAARTLTEIGLPGAERGREAVLDMLAHEDDESAMWYAIQAADKLKTDPKQTVALLIKVIQHGESTTRTLAIGSLGNYGPAAASAKSEIIRTLRDKDTSATYGTLCALSRIGMTDQEAAEVAQIPFGRSLRAASDVFHFLLRWPDQAKAFAVAHPGMIASFAPDDPDIVELFASADPKSQNLRDYLLSQPDLPPFTRIDFSNGEQMGFIMTWPRQLDDRNCFPQSPWVVKVTGEHADLAKFATNPTRKMWESEGLIPFSLDHRWGMVNPEGRIVIKPEYLHVEPCHEKRIVVYDMNGYGVIDATGQVIVRPELDWIYSYSGEIAAAKSKQLWGFLSLDGTWLIRPTYKRMDPYGEGWMITFKDGTTRVVSSRMVREELVKDPEQPIGDAQR